MHNSDQDKQDQRENSGMEDSTAMTIEFLRKRLLSERSVSKSARQRADELANRVAELEEQLKVVSLQRKKAERATADVLAILENQGISDTSEAFDSSSDQEIFYESKAGNDSTKEEESSVNSKVRRNEREELSGSDLDSSPVVPGRSLSWKGRKNASRSLEKCKDSSLSRRSSFASNCSSPKHRLGKSCRKIRGKETRSVGEEFKTGPTEVDPHENRVPTSEGFPNFLNGGPEILRGGSETQEEKISKEGPDSGCLENQRNVTNSGLDLNGYGRDSNMEKALEHQAQLIGQYEAMEKAQREWEEKFRENNSSTPDSCDPGNHSDITEERDDIKVQALCPVETAAIPAQEMKSEVEDVCFSKELSRNKQNGFLQPSHVDLGHSQDEKCSSVSASNFPTQEFAFPVAKGEQIQENFEAYPQQFLHRSHLSSRSHGFPGNKSADASSSDAGSSSRKGESGSRNDLYALVPHSSSDGLGGILDALKQAKISLEQKINRMPLIEGGSFGKAIEPSFPAAKTGDRVEIPVGCAGLFRLPTDFSLEATTQENLLGSRSRLTLPNYYRGKEVAITAGDQSVTSPYLESRPRFSSKDKLLTSQYAEIGSRVSTQKSYSDSYSDTGLPSSSRYTYPAHASEAIQYADIGSRMPTQKPYSDPYSDAGVPSSNRYTSSTQASEASQYADIRSGMPTQKPYSDPYSDAGLPSSNRYTSPTHASEASQYADIGSRMPTQKPYSDPYSDAGLPSSNRYTSAAHASEASQYADIGSRMLTQKPYSDPYSDASRPSSNRYTSAAHASEASQYADIGSRMPTQKPYSDPYSDVGLPSSNRYNYPIHASEASQYADIGSRMPNQKSYSDHYLDAGLPSSNRYTYPIHASEASQYADTGSRMHNQKSYSDRYSDAGLPSSSRYTYPTYPSYPDVMLRMPSKENLSRALPNRAVGIPPPDNFSFYDDHIRQNTYR